MPCASEGQTQARLLVAKRIRLQGESPGVACGKEPLEIAPPCPNDPPPKPKRVRSFLRLGQHSREIGASLANLVVVVFTIQVIPSSTGRPLLSGTASLDGLPA
jgi:hypothetical protein